MKERNKNRPGYKKTKVGWIPEDWECKRFGDLAKFLGGNAFSSNDAVNQGVRWLKIANVGVHTAKWDVQSYLPEAFLVQHSKYELREDDIVMALTRPILDGKLKIAILNDEDVPCLLNQRVAKIDAKTEQHALFLYYLANRAHFIYWMSAMMAGTDPPNIGFTELGFISVPSPSSLPEQEAIAEVLECWDKVIRVYEKKIEKKKNIKKGLMKRLLLGKQRLPGFSGEWKEVRLGEVGNFSKGKGITKEQVTNKGIPCIRYGEIYTTDDYVISAFRSFITQDTALMSKLINHNDLLMAGSGETIDEIGKSIAFIGDTEAYAGGDIIIFSPTENTTRADYLSYYLNTQGRQELRRLGQGQSVVHLYSRDLNDVCITLPVFEEQHAITSVLSSAESEISALERKLASLKEQKRFLLTNLVTGTIRLPQFINSGEV